MASDLDPLLERYWPKLWALKSYSAQKGVPGGTPKLAILGAPKWPDLGSGPDPGFRGFGQFDADFRGFP